MLTPIKKQGDEHIYILLQIGIINWISVCYVDILRFVWMLISSIITYGDALSILYEVHVIGNHSDRDMVLLKKRVTKLRCSAIHRQEDVLHEADPKGQLLAFSSSSTNIL